MFFSGVIKNTGVPAEVNVILSLSAGAMEAQGEQYSFLLEVEVFTGNQEPCLLLLRYRT